MRKILSLLLIVCLSTFMVLGCSTKKPAQEEVKPVTMKLAWAESDGHPLTDAFNVFKADVEKRTNGKIQVELYPAGQLGDAKSMIEQVKQGMIQSCASIPSGLIAGTYYNNFNIFEVPYLFQDNNTAWGVINPKSAFFKDISNDMAVKTGIRPFAFLLEGQRHFTNSKKEIRTPEDLKGLKIRTMEVPAHMKMVEALGGMPTPISWLELYSALETGVVDGQENPIFNIQYLKAHEVQKYLTLDGHITLFNIWVVNEKWFNDLSAELREALTASIEVAAQTHRDKAEAMNKSGVKDLEEKGMKVYTPTAEELNMFKEISQKAVIPYIEKNVDDISWIDKLNKELEKNN